MVASLGASAAAAGPVSSPATDGVPSLAADPVSVPAVTPTNPAASRTSAAAEPAAAPDPTPEPGYRFTGYGTDHGVGLSQRGAAGRAAAGQTYDQIIDHYFYHVRLGTVPVDTTIRALVVSGYRAAATQTPLIQGGKGGPGNKQMSKWTFDTPGVDGHAFPYSWRLVLLGTGATGAWHLEVQDTHGNTRLVVTDSDARVTVSPVASGADPGRLRVLVKPGVKYDTYEGVLRIGRANGRIKMVNVVPIEPFVRSVTPAELGPANLPETLKSQAVVARSYFLAGLSSSQAWLGYDVESYRASESYRGTKGENSTVTRAVDATAYQVVAYKGTAPRGTRQAAVLMPDGSGGFAPDAAYYIARTFYHAVGGGATEASQNVFTSATGKPGSKTPYLRGGPDLCPDPKADDYPNWDHATVACDASASAFSWSSRAFTLSDLSAMLSHDSRTNVGTLTRWPIESEATFRAKRAASVAADRKDTTPSPTNRGISGRLTWVVLVGTRGGKTVTKRVAGWLFKSVFNARRGSGDALGSTMIFRTPAH